MDKANVFTFSSEHEVLLKLEICGKPYTFNCSPSNYDFVKRVAALSRQAEIVLRDFNAQPKEKPEDVEKAFDFLCEKEKEIIGILLPGKWDELFDLANHDLMNMVDLIAFISNKVKEKGAAAKIASVAPVAVPQDAQEL